MTGRLSLICPFASICLTRTLRWRFLFVVIFHFELLLSIIFFFYSFLPLFSPESSYKLFFYIVSSQPVRDPDSFVVGTVSCSSAARIYRRRSAIGFALVFRRLPVSIAHVSECCIMPLIVGHRVPLEVNLDMIYDSS